MNQSGHILTNDYPRDENNLMGDGGARPQQPQGTIGLPAWTGNQRISLEDSVNKQRTNRLRWRRLPSEHAVDDGEEEDEVDDAFPVRHHHGIGRTQMRLALRRRHHVKNLNF